MVTIRRPGGPAPEELDALDMKSLMESSKYQVGVGMIDAEGKYEVSGLEPGKYILEIPRMPADLTDLSAYAKMTDRTPYYRKEVTIEEKDLEVNIKIERKE